MSTPLGSDHTTQTHASPGELLSTVTKDLSDLVRQEIQLAKAEATQSAKQAGTGAGMLTGAAVAGHFVLLFLSIALWWVIGNATGRSWSALIVTVIWAIIAAILASVGKKNLQKVKGLPQTTDTVKEIPNAVKGHEENNR
jgi:Putative Actinobacterial Holin-X, holin superfamily III